MINVEAIKEIGAVIGLVAGLITLGERIMSFRSKYQKRDRRYLKTGLDKLIPLARQRRSSAVATYLFRQEVVPVLAVALLINFVSLSLSTRLTSILYLDMTGTAVAALLLGPWYGAIAGLLSNGLINWLLYPLPNADVVVFPWAIVNISGGLLWGYMGRLDSFAKFMATRNAGLERQVGFLFLFGVVGAAVMAVPGTAVEFALGSQGTLALDPAISSALDELLQGSVPSVSEILPSQMSKETAQTVAHALVSWAQNTARYVPDKTLSFAIAIVIVKAGFPVFERELIHTRVSASKWNLGWLDPFILCGFLLPYTAVMITSTKFHSGSFWWLWIAPLAVASIGAVFEKLTSGSANDALQAKQHREAIYKRAQELLPKDAAARPGPNFALACLAATLLFVLFLPLLVPNYLRVGFNFFCLVYGFQLTLHLYSLAVCQNLVARTDRAYVARKPTPKPA